MVNGYVINLNNLTFPTLIDFTCRFLKNGGKIVNKEVEKFDDLYGKFDAIFNCTGFGAKSLCNDNKLVPIRGQIIKVRAPWVKTAFFGDYDTYIIPGRDSVTLGGCRQYDSYNLNVCKYDSAAIRERCETLLPSLVGAQVDRELVGLRPHRDPVRVELENVRTARGNLRVIHNYGHGGYGVTTSPGTAKYAVKIFRNMHKANSKL